MHARPETTVATTVAVDLAKDVFELAFVDADQRILECKRLSRSAFAYVLDNRGLLPLNRCHHFAAGVNRHVDALPSS